MQVINVEIQGLKIVELDIWRDSRGYFNERFNLEKFRVLGLPDHFVQDNHSFSYPRVLRGLHFQKNPDQGKLVGVTRGRIWDVAVDLRADSPTYKKHFGIELSQDNGKMLWIPSGFAHGFCVLGSEPADVLYKIDALYNPSGEKGICWSDPELNISWPVKEPLISERDARLPTLNQLLAFR